VGAGIAGTTVAGALQRQGVHVDLVELEAQPTFRGIGITLLPPAVRAMHVLGLADACLERGFPQHTMRTCTADGTVLASRRLEGLLGPDYPPAIGISRPELGEILREHAVGAGVEVRWDTTVVALENGDGGVAVELSDGTSGTYDVLVAADGLRSAIRAGVFPELEPPVYIGQCGWRVRVGERPDDIDGMVLYLGERTRAGFNPILPDDMYLFFLHQTQDERPVRSAEESHALLMELLGEYGGLVEETRHLFTPKSPSHYGPLYTTFVSGPWHRGRVILIGDAAHATPPHLASGAGIAIEDAIVLARCVSEHGSVAAAFDSFMRQRYERCRMVIEASRTLSRWDLDPNASGSAAASLASETWAALSEPI
jgi:2-polyprenyl-6-methoxyphenol hydroxylase-like FAD-dependent oxidoreductase